MATRTATVTQIQSPIRKFGSQNPSGSRVISTLALDTGDDGQSAEVVCDGASRLYFSVSADLNHQLATCSVVLTMTDGKTITAVPGVFPNGADIATTPLNAAGVLITLDLSSTAHRGLEVRLQQGAAVAFSNGPLVGVKSGRLSLAKAATAAVCTYTIVGTAYTN